MRSSLLVARAQLCTAGDRGGNQEFLFAVNGPAAREATSHARRDLARSRPAKPFHQAHAASHLRAPTGKTVAAQFPRVRCHPAEIIGGPGTLLWASLRTRFAA